MNIKHLPNLILFGKIIQCGSFTVAAKELKISRSVLSKEIAKLEESLGYRLFYRDARKITLTDLGEKTYEYTLAIDENINKISEIKNCHDNNISGMLRITCSTAIGRVHLIPILKKFITEYPLINIELYLEDRLADLIQEKIDVAIRIGDLANSSLVAKRLGMLQRQIVVSPTYIKNFGIPARIEDLADHHCLYYKNYDSAINIWQFEKDNKQTNIHVKDFIAINDPESLVKLALEGAGILLIDKTLLVDYIKNKELIPIFEDYKLGPIYSVYAVYPTKRWLPIKTRVFIDFLATYLQII